MKRVCNKCDEEMIEVDITIRPRLMDEIVVRSISDNKVWSYPKAVLCPSCGELVLYIEDFKRFID